MSTSGFYFFFEFILFSVRGYDPESVTNRETENIKRLHVQYSYTPVRNTPFFFSDNKLELEI